MTADQRDEERSDRRQSLQRRVRFRQESIYRTRREWIIAEFIIGIVSCATGLTGISGGIVSDTLQLTANNAPWFFFFYLSGAAFIIISFIENRCRSNLCGRDVLVRYAYTRFIVHVGNFFCWGMAFLWLHFSNISIASIYWESVPLALVNCWAMTEHAKALWLNPCKATTTSLFAASFTQFRSN